MQVPRSPRPLFFAVWTVMPAFGGSIEGRVANIVTGAGIAGVGVQVTAQISPDAGTWVISGEDGGFRIDASGWRLLGLDDGKSGGDGQGVGRRISMWSWRPGRYAILPQTAPGYYLAAAMLDGQDAKGKMVEIDGPAEIHTIYKTDGGSVRGRVENGAGAAVVLMADVVDAAPGIRIGYSARCDDAGSFATQEIAPGGYTIAAFRDGEEIKSGHSSTSWMRLARG